MLRDRLGSRAPPEIGPRLQGPQAGARWIDEHTVILLRGGPRLSRVGPDHADDLRSHPPGALLERSRPAGSGLDGADASAALHTRRQMSGLPARGRAEVEHDLPWRRR